MIEPVGGAGDDDGIARLVGLVPERVDHLNEAQRLAGGALGVHPARTGRIGGDVLCNGGRQARGCERGGDELARVGIVERRDLPVPARMCHPEQRLIEIRRGRRGPLRVLHAVDGDGVDELLQLPVEARLHVVAVEPVDDEARDRQHQQRPRRSGGEQPERERVETHLVSRFRSSPVFAAGVASELRNHKGH